MIKLINVFKLLFVSVLSGVFVFTNTAFSLGVDQRNVIASGAYYYNIDETTFCASENTVTASDPIQTGSKIYLLGDSIANRSQNEIRQSFEAGGFPNVIINSDSGRAISYDSAGNQPTGLEAANNDVVEINTSDAVIIALGTNSGNEDLNVQIPALINTIRDGGFNGYIYWVDLFYTINSGPLLRNAAIESQSTSLGYTVIKASNAGIPLDPDGVHPSAEGNSRFAETLLNGIKTAAVSVVEPNLQGNCQCSVGTFGAINTSITWGDGVWGAGSDIYESGLSGPYTIEQWAIHVLKNISRKSGVPENTLVTEDKVISMIAWAKAEGGGVDGHNGTFNPLNTKLNHSDLGGVNQGNAATDSNSQGYPSFDLGVEAITRGLFNTSQKRIGSAILNPSFPQGALIEAIAGDFIAEPYGTSDQSNVINRLESLYPGDRVYAALSITGFDYGGGIGDRDKYVAIKRSTLENVKENYADYAGKILDGSPPGTPAPLIYDGLTGGVGYDSGACVSEGGGNVSSEGYAFPLAPQTKQVSGVYQNHWDGTPGVDLFSGDSADVYSYYSGTPVTINTNFNGVEGCTSIQFQADDGFFYWYGHLKNPTVQEGEPVAAGVKIAEVADSSFGTDCVGGGPHLHIDRGCTLNGVPQRGGTDGCRDPSFVTELRELYETLPSS